MLLDLGEDAVGAWTVRSRLSRLIEPSLHDVCPKSLESLHGKLTKHMLSLSELMVANDFRIPLFVRRRENNNIVRY